MGDELIQRIPTHINYSTPGICNGTWKGSIWHMGTEYSWLRNWFKIWKLVLEVNIILKKRHNLMRIWSEQGAVIESGILGSVCNQMDNSLHPSCTWFRHGGKNYIIITSLEVFLEGYDGFNKQWWAPKILVEVKITSIKFSFFGECTQKFAK